MRACRVHSWLRDGKRVWGVRRSKMKHLPTYYPFKWCIPVPLVTFRVGLEWISIGSEVAQHGFIRLGRSGDKWKIYWCLNAKRMLFLAGMLPFYLLYVEALGSLGSIKRSCTSYQTTGAMPTLQSIDELSEPGSPKVLKNLGIPSMFETSVINKQNGNDFKKCHRTNPFALWGLSRWTSPLTNDSSSLESGITKFIISCFLTFRMDELLPSIEKAYHGSGFQFVMPS